jgi:hypothetical protein
MRKSRAAAICLLLMTSSGCMQYLVQPPAPSIAGSPQQVKANSYLGSEVQQPPYVLAQQCRNGEQLARVIVKRDFGQGLVSWITFGLVAPATIVYECANVNEPGIGGTSEGGGG